MITKYGEVKTISDLFELIEKSGETRFAGWQDSHTFEKFKCKICGDFIEEYVGPSVGMLDVNREKKSHIELHERIIALGIEK